jgi:hypothetical protein
MNPRNSWLAGSLVGESQIEGEITVMGVKLGLGISMESQEQNVKRRCLK